MRSISYRIEDLKSAVISLGFVGENERTQVILDSAKVFGEYPEAVTTLAVIPPEGAAYPKTVTREGNSVIWEVTDSDLAAEGDGEIQLTFTEGSVVAKSYTGRFRVCRSIVADGEAPDPVTDWITEANEKLAAAEEATTAASEAASAADAAADAIDDMTVAASGLSAGASPTVQISEVSGHKHIAFGIPQGAKGDPGDPGDPSTIIDDTSTAANKVWSASKSGELMNAIDGILVEETVGETATLTNKENASGFSATNFKEGFGNAAYSDGVVTYTAITSTQKSPYVSDSVALGSKKWVVGFKYRATKLSQSLGDPSKVQIHLGLYNSFDASIAWGEWVYFSKIITVDLARVRIALNDFEVAPAADSFKLEIKDLYIYDATGVSDDLCNEIIAKQNSNYTDGTVTYGEPVTEHVPDKSLTEAGKAADAKAVGDAINTLYEKKTKTLANAVSLNNFVNAYGMKRDSIADNLVVFSSSSTSDVNPSIKDQCALGEGNRIVSFKYKITKNDQTIGDPQYIRIITGASEYHYRTVKYDEWCYVQIFTTVNLTRVYFELHGYSTAPTADKVTVQIKDYYVYSISDVKEDMLCTVINSQKSNYKDGTVEYAAIVPTTRTQVNALDFGIKGNGTDDDTDAINAFFKAFNGVVYFPKGTYLLHSTVEIFGDTEVIGDGKDTVFDMASLVYPIEISIRLGPILPYMLVRSANVKISKIKLKGNTNYAAGFHWGICVYNTTHCHISDVVVTDINCDFTEQVDSKLGYGIACALSSFVIIENCDVRNCGYECIGFYDGCDHGIVRDCYTQDGKRTCIQVHRNCSDMHIKHNYAKQDHNKHNSCIVAHGLNTDNQYIVNLWIEDNIMEVATDGAYDYTYNAPLQMFAYINNLFVTNNRIFGGKRAAYFDASVDKAFVSGNIMHCNDQSDYGVTLKSTNSIVVGNNLVNDASTSNDIANNPVIVGNVGIS